MSLSWFVMVFRRGLAAGSIAMMNYYRLCTGCLLSSQYSLQETMTNFLPLIPSHPQVCDATHVAANGICRDGSAVKPAYTTKALCCPATNNPAGDAWGASPNTQAKCEDGTNTSGYHWARQRSTENAVVSREPCSGRAIDSITAIALQR